jgi:hypothetical protein
MVHAIKDTMSCIDEELVTTFENNCVAVWIMDFQHGYRNYLTPILNNDAVVDIKTATENHLTSNFYKWVSKYIQKLHPIQSKWEEYEVIKGIFWWGILR